MLNKKSGNAFRRFPSPKRQPPPRARQEKNRMQHQPFRQQKIQGEGALPRLAQTAVAGHMLHRDPMVLGVPNHDRQQANRRDEQRQPGAAPRANAPAPAATARKKRPSKSTGTDWCICSAIPGPSRVPPRAIAGWTLPVGRRASPPPWPPSRTTRTTDQSSSTWNPAPSAA